MPLVSLAQPASGPVGTFPRIPPVAADKALEGRALVEALRGGGYVLYVRHGETGGVTETCETSNLTAGGRFDAVRIGNALRELMVPFDKAISSEVCRAWETARLINVAPVEVNEDLHRAPKRPGHDTAAGRARLIGTIPPAKTNRLLAGHMQNGEKPEDRLFLDQAEVVIFRPIGNGKADVVARVRADEWQALVVAAGVGASASMVKKAP